MADIQYKDWAVMITRAQPFHEGHLEIIKQMMETHKNVLILIGSANKEGTLRNPFPVRTRINMVAASIDELVVNTAIKCNVNIKPLDDWSMENYSPAVKEWGKYLYYSIVYLTGCKTFDFYYNDDISIAKNWFTEELLERISFVTVDRTKVMDGVSSTKIREALLNDDNEYLVKSLPSAIDIDYLKNRYKDVVKNPKEDFIMK